MLPEGGVQPLVAVLGEGAPASAAAPASADLLPPSDSVGELSRADPLLVNALTEDGRCTYDELARVSGVSEATARRRLGALRRAGRVRVRAVIEPVLLGLPVEAVLWVRAVPTAVDSVTAALAGSPHVRYVSFVTGERQLLVLTAFPDEAALHDFVTRSTWLREAVSVDVVSMVLGSLKRGECSRRGCANDIPPVSPIHRRSQELGRGSLTWVWRS
ncbi:Lrp/AsnC family transcriptional regulator [Streptomyces sp. NPDC048564]|uniref:Lrp/AsnC family transcriptional regulator n=1 Tax=Streptomyces sp. NPDC048564 TaxID=3155760 RepID=UPI00342C7548